MNINENVKNPIKTRENVIKIICKANPVTDLKDTK